MPAITLHDGATSGQLIGVACDRCMRHAMLTAVQARAKVSDARTLEEAGGYCGKCGSRRFTATRFHTRSAAHAFMRNL
jgi:uncharacterized OB-fold protein